MSSHRFALVWATTFLFLTACPWNTQADTPGESCAKTFQKGQDNFFLDTAESINEGATYVGIPTVQRAEDCVNACCQDPNCNLALIELGLEEGSVKNCFLFDCLYKQKYVCRFVKKIGFTNFILDSVYDNYLKGPIVDPGEKDKHPIANGGQDTVVQPNERVTLNGIESWDDKKIANYEWRMLKGDVSVVLEKTKLEDQLMVSNLLPGLYVFQLTVTDSIGQSDATKITILVLNPEQSDSHCLVPKKVGPCRGAFPRWHYNAVSEKCEGFVFGGCKENKNNYLSQQECLDACDGASATSGRRVGEPTEVCGSPCEAGQFTCTSGCCLDNGLECDGVQQCSDGSDEASCARLNRTLSRLLDIDVNEQRARCTEPPRTGACRASMTRWYYDPLNRKCYRFNYGGCDGNENNFEVEDTCMKICESVTEKDVFARGLFERSKEEESKSGSIAVAAVLGVGILALLALLGYCFLKDRKRESQHQRVAASNPQVPFREDTEHLVYNTTTTTKPV